MSHSWPSANGAGFPDLWTFPAKGGDPDANWTETAGFGPVRPLDLITMVWQWAQAPPRFGPALSNDTSVSVELNCANRNNLTDLRRPAAAQNVGDSTTRERDYEFPAGLSGRWSCYLSGQMVNRPLNPNNGQKTKVFGYLGEASGTPIHWRNLSLQSGASNPNTTTTTGKNSTDEPMGTPTNTPTMVLDTQNSSLSTGATAGIAVGSMMFGILGVILAVWWTRRRRKLCPTPKIDRSLGCAEKDGFPVANIEDGIMELKDDCIYEMRAELWYEKDPVELQ